MTKPKHTPGPWASYKQNGEIYIEENCIPENTLTIATVHRLENAALISAAPEMLEAIRRSLIQLMVEVDPTDEHLKTIVIIKDAIAKARGEL